VREGRKLIPLQGKTFQVKGSKREWPFDEMGRPYEKQI
jgi:hypothetical protein